jgi:prepilin-type N-terminal cleavage/methylation domain-containing protein
MGSFPSRRRGFTLVELAVVVVIIGILAAFGVPRLMQSVERSRASEAFFYLSAVQSAQQRYHAREGTYADDLTKLDVQAFASRYFVAAGKIEPGATGDIRDSWSLTLTRSGPSSGYGAYTVTYNERGLDRDASTILDEVQSNDRRTTRK